MKAKIPLLSWDFTHVDFVIGWTDNNPLTTATIIILIICAMILFVWYNYLRKEQEEWVVVWDEISPPSDTVLYDLWLKSYFDPSRNRRIR